MTMSNNILCPFDALQFEYESLLPAPDKNPGCRITSLTVADGGWCTLQPALRPDTHMYPSSVIICEK